MSKQSFDSKEIADNMIGVLDKNPDKTIVFKSKTERGIVGTIKQISDDRYHSQVKIDDVEYANKILNKHNILKKIKSLHEDSDDFELFII
jgi:hypothetical protein